MGMVLASTRDCRLVVLVGGTDKYDIVECETSAQKGRKHGHAWGCRTGVILASAYLYIYNIIYIYIHP